MAISSTPPVYMAAGAVNPLSPSKVSEEKPSQKFSQAELLLASIFKKLKCDKDCEELANIINDFRFFRKDGNTFEQALCDKSPELTGADIRIVLDILQNEDEAALSSLTICQLTAVMAFSSMILEMNIPRQCAGEEILKGFYELAIKAFEILKEICRVVYDDAGFFAFLKKIHDIECCVNSNIGFGFWGVFLIPDSPGSCGEHCEPILLQRVFRAPAYITA